MSRTSICVDARVLLQECLRKLLTGDHRLCTKLRLRGTRSNTDPLAAKKTWIIVDLDGTNPEEIEQLRVFTEIVSQLSHCASFQWWNFYYSFWKEALMNQLGCRTRRCSSGCAGTPVPTEFDNFERLMESDGPRFLLELSKCVLVDNEFEPLRSFLFMDPEHAFREECRRMLSKVARRDRRRNEDGGDSIVPVLSGKEPSRRRIEFGVALPTHMLATSQHRALSELLREFAEQGQENQSNGNAVRYEITAL